MQVKPVVPLQQELLKEMTKTFGEDTEGNFFSSQNVNKMDYCQILAGVGFLFCHW